MTEYSFIDLFSGAGGMSLGFVQGGFKNVVSIECNPNFANTYKRNFPYHNLVVSDIKDIKGNYIEKIIKDSIGNKKVDVIIGGPPCQGFSIAGRIGRSFIEDERNGLFKEFVRIVDLVRPKLFVMENVAALKTHNKGNTIKEIVKSFENLGYEVKEEVLNSVNYGVPQERRRIFIVGMLDQNIFDFPVKEHKIITIKEAIGDLPKLKNGEKSSIPNHYAMNHSKQMLEKMSYIKDGGNRYQIPYNLRPKSGDIRKYIRYNSNKPSFCITGDMRKVFHYEQNRALSSRELARLQTFPDDFVFVGKSIEIQQQIGNAVPPKLAKKIALKVREALDNA